MTPWIASAQSADLPNGDWPLLNRAKEKRKPDNVDGDPVGELLEWVFYGAMSHAEGGSNREGCRRLLTQKGVPADLLQVGHHELH